MNQLLRLKQERYLLYLSVNFTLQKIFKSAVLLCFLLGTSQLVQAQQCSVTISKVTVSGCYLVGNQSKSTVSVEVAWTGAPANGIITVTLGAQTRQITPGLITVSYPQAGGNPLTGDQTILSPQVVAFEVDANGSTNNPITAKFNNTCTTSTTYNAPASCALTPCSGNNVGGIVFKDFNDNGVKDAGETAGVAGVTVKGIACDGTVYNAITDGYGYYSLPVAANKYPVRVEFSDVPSIYKLGVNGAGSRTSVQFVSAPACNVNLGIVNPIDYCSDNNLKVFVPCFTYGDPLVTNSTSAAADALVGIPYGVSSSTFQGEQTITTAGKIGTVWGLAYNKYTKRLFLSAVLKRHAGLGPLGLGGLYLMNYSNPASPTVSNFLDVSSIGINVGSIATNSARGLVGDKTQPSRDSQSFSEIGKIGIGDMDIAEDGNTLWMINMNDKKLYSIDITQFNQDGTTLPTVSNVNFFTIPVTCVGGEYRPWAVKVYNGKVYVGGVCDASSSTKSNLRASVYELSGNTFTQIFDFPLTYPKGYPAANNTDLTGWFPWTDNFDDLTEGTGTTLRYPVPIFTDIEFDIDGSMVLAFGDRTGLQGGDKNYRPNSTSTTLYETNSQAGDILRAFYANGTFVLENNAKAGPNEGYGPNNSQGPGFGEFYNDNWIQDGNPNRIWHAEQIMGALALKPGSGEVVVTTIDPVNQQPYAGGVRYMDNSDGEVTGSYSVYVTRTPGGNQVPGTFAKATGLGDIELSCDNLEIIEIGNRVWLDTNKDGVQDACEKGLKDVNVTLYKGTTKIATTKTDANGEYYFSRKSKLTTGTWSATGADTVVRPTTAYSLVFGTGGQITGTNDTLKVTGIGKFLLTQKDAVANTGNDLNDSDAAKTAFATENGSFPIITFTTGTIATTNHTFDAGFYCVEPYNYKVAVTQATCTGITANSNAKIDFTDVKCADKYAFSKNSGDKFTGAAYAAATAISGSAFTLNNLSNPATAAGDTFYVRLYNGLCCYKDTIVILPFKDCSCVKPVVTAAAKNQAVCAGEAISPFAATTLPAAGLTLKWYGPLNDTLGSLGTAIVGATTASYTPPANFTGKKYFAVVAAGAAAVCSDTAFVSLTINPRPVANATAKKQTICVGELPTAFTATPSTGVSYAWYGAMTDTTGSLGTAIAGAASATFTPSGAAITTVGIKYYAVVVTTNQTSCKDTAFVQLTVNAKPDAGPDYTGGNAICNTVASVDLPNAANGESWVQLGNTPKTVTINASTGVVTGIDAIGTYQFILSNSTTGCADTVAVEVKNCAKGSLGDFVWKDVNDNGIQDLPAEKGVKGVIVQLLNSTNNVVLATDTTDASGIYSFTGLDSGTYKVKIVLSSLPDTCQISSKQDVNTGGGTDANDSDFNPTTGESQVVTINTLDSGLAKDNPTIDAALVRPCIQPAWQVTTAPTCSPAAAVYSVSFSMSIKNGMLKVNAGTLSGNNPYTVSNIPNGVNLIITDSLRANCVNDTTIVAPDCSCPQITVLTQNATACKGDTLPTLKVFLAGNTNGVGAEWYADAVGGSVLGSGLSFKPSGTISLTDTFYVELTGTTGACLDQPRTPVIVSAQDCEVDLALKKLINKKIAQIGDTLTYTIKVWNEFVNDASGVEVTDSIATTVGFIANSFVASRGSAVISGTVIKWAIGNIAANGDTVTLTYQVKATQQGVHFNVAEISKTNEKDRDSTPGNGKEEEDDIDRQCFTVPFKLCPTNKLEAGVAMKYTNVQWFKDGGTTAIATGNVVLLSDVGTYTFTATNATCPAEGCCPIIIEPGDNCCPDDLCIPFTIQKTKKGK